MELFLLWCWVVATVKYAKTKRLLCEYQDLCGYISWWWFGNLEVLYRHINLSGEFIDNLISEAKKYGRIFEFWIQISGVENCYGVTGFTKV